jgi:tRNA pseudouridine38-40 synthase
MVLECGGRDTAFRKQNDIESPISFPKTNAIRKRCRALLATAVQDASDYRSIFASRQMKFKLIIAYDGANYEGWQTQKTGTGVQQVVENALAKLFQCKPALHGSSRTDTGVHALGMAAHFEIPPHEFKMTLRKLPLAINAWLPEDIRILSAVRAPGKFHARFDAVGKQYRYFIWNHSAMNPLLRRAAWHVPVALDLRQMRVASKLFVGKHDFQSFAANSGYKKENTVRTISKCEIKKSGPQITVIIEGDGFLYKMCRGMVGTIVQSGLGKFPPGQVRAMLAQKDRRVAGMSAPAHGLVLWRVYY